MNRYASFAGGSMALCGVSLLLAVTAFAQEHGGTITGSVKDPIGGNMPAASVQATSAADGSVHKATSSKQGEYSLPDLPAGKYDVSVNVGGLSPFSQKGVEVAAGKTVRLDVKLKEGMQLGTLGEDPLAIADDQKRHHPPSGPTPRTEYGKPDLTGVYWAPRTVDAGKPEWLPAAAEVAKERAANNRKDSPQTHCLPSAVTRIGFLFQFVQTKNFMVFMMDDDSPGFHQIYLDGRPHLKEPDPRWYGHNIGHWDGDTLVVDRVDFEEQVWLDGEAHPHSDRLHLIERYRRPDLGHLEIETTIEDPGVLAKPYTMKRVADLAPGEEIREFICTENNADLPHLVGK